MNHYQGLTISTLEGRKSNSAFQWNRNALHAVTCSYKKTIALNRAMPRSIIVNQSRPREIDRYPIAHRQQIHVWDSFRQVITNLRKPNCFKPIKNVSSTCRFGLPFFYSTTFTMLKHCESIWVLDTTVAQNKCSID